MLAKPSGSNTSSSASSTMLLKGGGAGIFRAKIANSNAATNGRSAHPDRYAVDQRRDQRHAQDLRRMRPAAQ